MRIRVRSVITIGAACIGVLLFSFANSAIISINMRNNEISRGMNNAIDYAIDILDDIYGVYDYSQLNEEKYINEVMDSFCRALNEKIDSDGDISVSLINYNMNEGSMDISVTEEFSYNFLDKRGRITSNRTVIFAD